VRKQSVHSTSTASSSHLLTSFIPFILYLNTKPTETTRNKHNPTEHREPTKTMSSTDIKKTPLLSDQEDVVVAAPPSYSASATSPTVGDGNIFSDFPRPGQMDYSRAAPEPYVARADRGNWTTSILGCFSQPTTCTHLYSPSNRFHS
jgi:hypothetical protein